MKHKRYITAFFTAIGFTLIGWFSFMRPDWLLLDGIFIFAFPVVLIVMCFTPAGSLMLGLANEKLSLWHWFRKLFLGQLAFIIFTLAAYVAYFDGGPSFASGEISLKFATSAIHEFSPWLSGILPIGVYGGWALIIAYVTYVKKGEPYLYQIAREYSPKWGEPMIKTFIEGTNNGATMMVFSLVACSIILLLSYCVEVLLGIHHFAVPFVTFTVLSFFTPVVSFKLGRKIFNFMTVKSKSYIWFYLFMIVLMVLFLILSSIATIWFIKKYPQIYQLQCQHCGNYFANIPLEARFAALYWGWWMIWMPLAGSYLAKISEGRSLREFVIGLFIFPFALWLAWVYWGGATFIHLKTVFQEGILYTLIGTHLVPIAYYASGVKSIQYITLGLATLFVFFKMIAKFHTSAVFHSGFMVVSDTTKEDRLWISTGSKIQGVGKIAQKLSLAMIATIFVHTLSGWYGIQIELTAMGLVVINALYVGFDLLLIRFFKEKIWLGNRNIPPY